MFKRMFSSSSDRKEKEKEKEKDKKLHRSRTVAAPERANDEVRRAKAKEKKEGSAGGGGEAGAGKSRSSKKSSSGKASSKKRKNKVKREIQVDTSVPIEYPCVPEILLEYHKAKPFLKPNEEWLVVELAEFECLVDSLEIIQIMAKHSKFFELDPPEMVEEFFEFVDEVPSYDEVVNYDVWQEFRDKRYPC